MDCKGEEKQQIREKRKKYFDKLKKITFFVSHH